jgi:Bifunctional DNA primase/polymerase, N-terminal/Primase C terminal 1 (PriCT-1)
MELIDAALRYADHGWPVFPCWGKEPATAHGLKDASTGVRQIMRWWGRWPQANIAIRTGRDSGLLVLDVDGEQGVESLRALERQHGELPRTASAKTPRGGSHFYFRHPGGEIRNSAGVLGTGLDVRGDGGYVIAPPSRVNGRVYEPDEQAPVADLPEWLIDLLYRTRGNGSARPVSEWRELAQNGAVQGERNERTAQLAGHLLRKGVDVYVTLALLEAWNLDRNRPPLPGAEVARVVDSIAACEARKLNGER